MKWLRIPILLGLMGLASCSAAQRQDLQAPVYEYKVMSLLDLFGDTDSGRAKIAQLMVTSSDGFRRTDMDVPDYQQALDKMAQQGWELVTINKSNYWIFRRLKKA